MPQPKLVKRQCDRVVAKISSKKSKCIFCERVTDNEVIFGKLYDVGDISCHYFCALLSCCLIQNGEDEDGLFGFLYSDIVAEAERGKKYKCSYCSQFGATVGCTVSQCKKQFHLPCGRERNAVSLFYGNYKSFCEKHAPKQNIPALIMETASQRLKAENRQKRKKTTTNQNNGFLEEIKEVVCAICYETVPGYPSTQTFWPSCCGKDAWFHRTCLQRMALASGMHYLKCPLCNDKDHFYRSVLEQGYYIPDRDAAWELETNAFAEIYERPAACGAGDCKCSLGREHDADSGAWELKMCLLCGSSCVHTGCMPPRDGAHYVCSTCQRVEPPDLDKLAEAAAAAAAAAALAAQREQTPPERVGSPMPVRMSLRRTKLNANTVQRSSQRLVASLDRVQDAQNEPNGTEPSSSKESVRKDVVSSRSELNLKSPKAYRPSVGQEKSPLKDLSNTPSRFMSPTKLVEEVLRDKIMEMNIQNMSVVDTKILIEKLREKYKKPRPLSAKRKFVSDILDKVLNDVLEGSKVRDDATNSKLPDHCEMKEVDEVKEETSVVNVEQPGTDITENAEPSTIPIIITENGPESAKKDELENDEDTKSTFELPSEFVAECNSDASLEAFEVPTKTKTISIDNNSSIEISEKDETVNIDVFKIDTEEMPISKSIVTEIQDSPRKDSRCTLKFSTTDKETLHDKNLDIDIEVFKNRYLNEVDRGTYKCAFNHKHEVNNISGPRLHSVIDFAIDAAFKKYNVEGENGNVSTKSVKRNSSLNRDDNKRRKIAVENETCNPEAIKETYLDTAEIDKNDGDVKKGQIKKRKTRRKKNFKRCKMAKIKNAGTINSTGGGSNVRIAASAKRKRSANKNIGKSKKMKIRLKKKLIKKNKEKREKINIENGNKEKFKQTILVFGSSNEKIIMSPVTIHKKKHKTNIKSPDNLKQMTLDNFFVLKIPC